MFGLFKSSPDAAKAKLEKKYAALLAESHRLSTIDRAKSDLKAAEADKVRVEIEQLEAAQA
ncbi:MAG: Lacal_2735 family protein [Planctomycetota bacterium]